MIFSEKLKSKVKVWHLIVFNLFFYILGESIARLLGGSLFYRNVFDILTTLLFIGFLFLILQAPKYLTFFPQRKPSKAILSAIFQGVFLWLLMTLYQSSFITLINTCGYEFCNTLVEEFRSDLTFIQYDKVSSLLVLVMIIRFSVVGPVAEELLYRTAIFLRLNKKYSAGWSAIIVALIFSVFHLKYFLFTILFSLSMSAMLAKHRCLLPAIIAHGLYNFLIYFIFPPGKFFNIEMILGGFNHLLAALLISISLFRSIKVINTFPFVRRNP